MQQKPKSAAEYQAEMMQLYRRAHPAQETIPESSPMPTETNSSATPAAPTSPLQPIPNLSSAPEPLSVPKSEFSPVFPENLPPKFTETLEEPTPESTPSDIITPPESSVAPIDTATTSEASLIRSTPMESAPSIQPQKQTPIMELEPIPKIAPNIAYGFLKVITRTGNEALPLPNVTVTVTAIEGANTRLYFSGITNESGETDHIPLPTPELNPNASPTNKQLYQSYDVTVYHPDYFRMESRGLPIFPGITSLQKFAMIPLPQRPEENTPTVVYENTEPEFPD